MAPARPTLYTKRQLHTILAAWRIVATLPRKGAAPLAVALPAYATDRVARIAWTDRVSDSGDRLYELSFYS